MFVHELRDCGFESRCSHLNFRYHTSFHQEFLDIQAKQCGFTLNRIHDTIIKYSQMRHTDKYSQHNSIIWPVWLSAFLQDLSGCRFASRCSHLTFCFKPEMPFLCKFGPKNQNCKFTTLKFGTQTNLNKRNSVVVLTFSVFDQK